MVTIINVSETTFDASKFPTKLADLAEILHFAIPAFYTSDSRLVETCYQGNCYKAVQAFGSLLTEKRRRYSLFEKIQDAQYFDLRSNGPFKGYSWEVHSLGFIRTPDGCVAIDLVYNAIDQRKPKTVMFVGNNHTEVLNELNKHYGGIWEPIFMLNPHTSKFRYIEE
jgi:hypothetical protein